MKTFLLFLFAILPGIIIAGFIYVKDKHEKEPWQLLVKTFVSGIIVMFIAGLLGFYISSYFDISNSIFLVLFQSFLIIAVIEEGSKYYLLVSDVYHNKEFNEPFDGITYSVMISMGFATCENIFYVISGGFETAMLRMWTAVPAHAIFGVLMGFFVGLAKFSNNSKRLKFMGFIIAVLFHGAYDFFLIQETSALLEYGAFAVLMVGILLSFKGIQILNHISPFKPEI